MTSLYLIDGSFELFRCYYGAPRAQLDDRREVGPARGVFQTLVSLLRKGSLTYAAIAFDDVNALEARELTDPELIHAQYDLAIDVSRALGIETWVMSEFTADAAIASAAHRYGMAPELRQIVICSSDNDFAQCVRGERVVILNRIRKERMSEAGVLEKFGVPPERIPEYLALVGDKSDGIPGIPGFGPNAAAAAIRRFGPMEDFPLEPAGWDLDVRGVGKLAATFRERREEALRYRDQSIKSLDVPLPEALEDLRWQGAARSKVEELAVALADPGMLDRALHYQESASPNDA